MADKSYTRVLGSFKAGTAVLANVPCLVGTFKTAIDLTAIVTGCLRHHPNAEVRMIVHRLGLMPLLVLAVSSCADPAALDTQDLPDLSVTAPGLLVAGSGHVQTAAGQREFTFHASEQPGGGVIGSYKVVLPNGLFFEADVTCMAVDGNTGWVAGTIRETNAAVVIVGSRSMFYAIDNGEGGAAADIVSLAAFNLAAGTDLAFCANRPLELPPLTVTDGNVQVR